MRNAYCFSACSDVIPTRKYVCYTSTECDGHDIDKDGTEGEALLTCRNQCDLPESKCKAFVHDMGNSRCYLKNYECKLNETVSRAPTRTYCRVRTDKEQ